MPRVIIIEDEDQIRNEVYDWLTFEGYEVLAAKDGREGLDTILKNPPDLILCDISMPHMTGHQVLMEVRANTRLCPIPFIFLTASADRASIRKGMNLGADDYITKPFSYNDVLSAVETRLQKQIDQEHALGNQVEEYQKILNSERNKAQLKTKFVAMFSHDFRNPLTSVLANSGLIRLAGGQMDEDQLIGHLDRIDRAVHILNNMVNDMLITSQMESGDIKCLPDIFNIVTLLDDIVEEQKTIDHSGHKITTEVSVTKLVKADSKLMRHILTNLLSNAVKYSPTGSEITITVQEKPKLLEIRVEDHGMGIPEQELSRLFTPFYRASNAKYVQGTGLGLTMVRQAVELHEGTIKVTSEQNEGTCIDISIPQPARL